MCGPVNEAAGATALEAHCRELRLPTVPRQHPELVRQAAHDGWDNEAFLLQLLEAEVLVRRDGAVARLLRATRFLDLMNLDQLDWDVLRGIKRPQLAQLVTREYIERGEDVKIAGPIGTGKTHDAIALGDEAIQRRDPVAFVRAADVVSEPVVAPDEHSLSRLHQRHLRVALLIVDQVGIVPCDWTGGELLFNLLADRYEWRSTVVTTNLAFSEWVQVFGDETLTTAPLDRLGHHAHILMTKGHSYRIRHARPAIAKHTSRHRFEHLTIRIFNEEGGRYQPRHDEHNFVDSGTWN